MSQSRKIIITNVQTGILVLCKAHLHWTQTLSGGRTGRVNFRTWRAWSSQVPRI